MARQTWIRIVVIGMEWHARDRVHRIRLLKVLTPGAETDVAMEVDAGLTETTFAAGVSEVDAAGLADNGFGVGFLSSGVRPVLAIA